MHPMSWRDRDYAREGSGGFSDNPLMWLLAGRVHLFRFWGVDVYLHASMIIVTVLVLLFGTPFGRTPSDRVIFVVVLFGIVLLHEFGHIWGARKTGGEGNEILMTPLGGLAMAQPATGWYSHTITIICGPLVNVLICLVVGGLLFATTGWWPLGPFSFTSALVAERVGTGWFSFASYAFYVYSISYFLLLFNMIPVYPLDGGQFLQGIIWKFTGYYRATMIATAIGMVGGILMALVGIATTSLLLAFIGIGVCFLTSLQVRRALKAAGPYAFGDEDDAEWRRSLNINPDEPEKVGVMERVRRKRQEKAAEREAMAAQQLEAEVDRILSKISQSGITSLTAREKRTLDEAREAKSRR